jgi:hypothetical protein
MHAAIHSQYRAALAMLRQAGEGCPDALWNDPADRNGFWHIAYHALFYTHLYIQVDESLFRPWDHHRHDYSSLDLTDFSPEQLPLIPYTKAEVLAYLTLVEEEIATILPALDLAAPESGFHWLPFGKLELQFYNIRHLSGHTGELCERLYSRARGEVNWVGRGS